MSGMIATNALAVAGVMVFLVLLRSSANRPAKRDPDSGELVLQCSPVLVWSMGTLAVGGALGMFALTFVIPFAYPEQVFVPVVLGGFFLVLGGIMAYWAASRRTRIGEKGLTSEYMFVKPRFLRWEDVERISFSSGQEFWVRGPRHKAMLHVWFVGVQESVPLLEDCLPQDVLEKYHGVLVRFRETIGA